MKKKTLSLALALVMCLGLSVPAFAAVPVSGAGDAKNISISFGLDVLSQEDLTVDEPWIQYDIDAETGTQQVGYTAMKKDTIITVTHSGTADDGSTLRVELLDYLSLGAMDEVFPNQIVRGSLGGRYSLTPDGWGSETGRIELKAGESKSFTIPFEDERFAVYGADEDGGAIYSDVFQVIAVMHDPQSGSDSAASLFVKENAAVCDAAIAKAASANTTDPESTTPTIEVENIPASGTALASTQTVTVDGKATEFQMYALADANGNLTNYIKLRDMAYILNGTKAQFSVGYDGIISLTKGQPYEAGGTEMTTPFSGDRAYTGGAQTLKIDGKDVAMTAITLTDDNGGGYNYFKLRDLGKALGFNVSWDNGVIVESDKPYAG